MLLHGEHHSQEVQSSSNNAMKIRTLNIIVIISALASLVCCTKVEVKQDGDLLIPYDSYIFFNSRIDTKGELVEEMAGKSFAVTAFKYDGEWGIVREATITPNVFYNDVISWNGTSHGYNGEEVALNKYTYFDSESNSYKKMPLIPWATGDTLYTFFAHYPYDTTNPKLSSGSNVGEPYLDYTLDRSDVSKMKDIMTADKISDQDNSISNSITFNMVHRLAAIDVIVGNYIDDIKVDGVTKKVTVRISNMSVNFDNLMYKDVSLWLDPTYRKDSELPEGVRSRTLADPQTATYQLLGSSPAEIANDTDVNITWDKEGTINKSLIVIPQDKPVGGDYLKGNLKFDFSFVDEAGNSVEVPLAEDKNGNGVLDEGEDIDGDGILDAIVDVEGLTGQSMEFNTQRNIEERRKYFIQLSFLNGAITLQVKATAGWIGEDVPIEFE